MDRTRHEARTTSHAKPLILFDGECGYCRWWVVRWRKLIGDAVEFEPYQSAAARFPQIEVEKLRRAVHYVAPDGAHCSGAKAVFTLMAHAPHRAWMLGLYNLVPGFAPLSELLYRFIASHRGLMSRINPCIFGHAPEPPTYALSNWIYLRLLGIIYLFAFLSFWTQAHGLVGGNGILPIGEYLARAASVLDPVARIVHVPTLCWLSPTDGFLTFLCAGGTIMSVALLAGIIPRVSLILLYVFYLSLVVAGQRFMAFQWDSLLLEAGFIAIFLSPWRLFSLPHHKDEPHPLPRLLTWWLLFRLMFSAGMVKLASGDIVWRDGTALIYHYWTQPIPSWTAWYMHQLPVWFHKASVLFMFGCELLAPLFIFTPRRARLLALWPIMILMILIELTGNFGPFNLLTMVLCLALLDDQQIPARIRRLLRFKQTIDVIKPNSFAASLYSSLRLTILTALFLLSIIAFGMTFLRYSGRAGADGPFARMIASVSPFRVANYYGLFAVMTKHRDEIILEGSIDGIEWREYEFKYKPGNTQGRPPLIGPHMPRLDWMMWFAALGDWRQSPWLLQFMERIRSGSPEVIALLANNPFPDSPPSYLRARLYGYRFTSIEEREAENDWWTREYRGLLVPGVD